MMNYATHSEITHPGEFGYLFDDLPRSLPELKIIVQGLILHFWDGPALSYKIPLNRISEIHTRTVSNMLKLLISKDSRPLLFPRSLDTKIIGSCRDFAILLCAILRHQGIPARVRAAFNLYALKGFYHDQVILEYWNKKTHFFCRVDPRVNGPDFEDATKDRLMLAGEAWLLVRENPEIADHFGGGNREKNKGLWYIRDRLIQDLAGLNKAEMQLWDVFGKMHMPKESLNDKNNLLYFDQLARLTIIPEKNTHELAQFFKENSIESSIIPTSAGIIADS